ncbi:hypothetical protein ACFUVV_04625 [Streptomyces sp. NPDC057376]|uniref:hypothetical protein n=1 Tax=Streptomyces sp. NPDC057376 TaxID=3346110 RepID=UPI00130165F0
MGVPGPGGKQHRQPGPVGLLQQFARRGGRGCGNHGDDSRAGELAQRRPGVLGSRAFRAGGQHGQPRPDPGSVFRRQAPARVADDHVVQLLLCRRLGSRFRTAQHRDGTGGQVGEGQHDDVRGGGGTSATAETLRGAVPT